MDARLLGELLLREPSLKPHTTHFCPEGRKSRGEVASDHSPTLVVMQTFGLQTISGIGEDDHFRIRH